MATFSDRIIRPLILKFGLALGLLAILAATNFILLRTEILASEAMASILNISGRQRILLHRTATLAEQLIVTSEPLVRRRLRGDLAAAARTLEEVHFKLMRPEATPIRPPETIGTIYEDAPWLLDSEMRNYVLHLQSLAESTDDAMNYGNAHFKYVRDHDTIDKIMDGLDAVVDVYQTQDDANTAHLRRLAIWSLSSTLALLFLEGWFVFRPMVRRVRNDVEQLNLLNETLDKRVAERTAEAEQRATQLVQSQGALRDSESLYRSLVENLPMCVLRKDQQGRFTFANEQFRRLADRETDQIIGFTDADLYLPELAAKYRADDRRVIESQMVLQDVERHRTPKGQEMFVEVIKAPLHNASGDVVGTQTVFWDVTARENAERRARHAERLAAIGQMVAGVAHESRNALQQMQACTQLLGWEYEQDDSKQALIDDMQAAQDRLHRLFDELREYASPLKLESGLCNIKTCFLRAWDSVSEIREGRDVSLTVIPDDHSPSCHADSFLLEQVFRNILENSLAACDDAAKIVLELSETLASGRKAIQIVFRDNGPGLTAEQQQRIFEPFYTTKTHGTGLGMAIVKQIIEAHGGDIEARRPDQRGVEFRITLPKVQVKRVHEPPVVEVHHA